MREKGVFVTYVPFVCLFLMSYSLERYDYYTAIREWEQHGNVYPPPLTLKLHFVYYYVLHIALSRIKLVYPTPVSRSTQLTIIYFLRHTQKYANELNFLNKILFRLCVRLNDFFYKNYRLSVHFFPIFISVILNFKFLVLFF